LPSNQCPTTAKTIAYDKTDDLKLLMSIELEQLTRASAQAILAQLPDRIREAYVERATRLNYPMTFGRS
jgi:hypothetical protein